MIRSPALAAAGTMKNNLSLSSRRCWIAIWTAVAVLATGSGSALAQMKPAKTTPAQAPAPANHYQAARAALASGDPQTAKLEVKLALQSNPLDPAAHFLLASILAQEGFTDQGIVGFQRALTLDPTNPETLYNLGTLLLLRGEAVGASNLLENAVSIRPNHIPSYNNLAKAYFISGIPELAVATYEEVLRRDPANVIALKNLAVLADAAGLHESAVTYLRRLEALGPGRATTPNANAPEPITPLPSWPTATAAASSPSPVPSPVITGAKAQATPDVEAIALRELVRDLSHVTVERRGGRLTLDGWTSSPKEKELLGRIIAGRTDVLDLTGDDIGDPQRMIEVDGIIFSVIGMDSSDVGFNFLRLIQTNLSYFASDHTNDGLNGLIPPGPRTVGAVSALAQQGWLFFAAIDYNVNIANASTERVALLARPHLTALSGTPATFLAGGELVFKVSGLNSGDIKPYPFGTTLTVTPTLLRTPTSDGAPRVHLAVTAGRTSIQALVTAAQTSDTTAFTKIDVTSEAVVGLNQTLILSGISQRESTTELSGVPVLRSIPILKYFFSSKTTVQTDIAVIILLTPRDPAYWGQKNRKELDEFLEKRRAFLRANQGTAEDVRRFRERYPDWDQIPPNRFASHFFLMKNSELYRNVSGQALVQDDLEIDIDLLGAPKKKKK